MKSAVFDWQHVRHLGRIGFVQPCSLNGGHRVRVDIDRIRVLENCVAGVKSSIENCGSLNLYRRFDPSDLSGEPDDY